MRRLILLFALLLLAFLNGKSQICEGKKVVLTSDGSCDETLYRLVFQDDFYGNSLDTSLWKVATGVLRDLDHKIAQQWYTSENVLVSGGTLKLITRRESLKGKCYQTYLNGTTQLVCEDFNFSAGQINSTRKFQHGIIEMSCKVPKGKGIGSSFWMFGDPGKNEVDIFEFENEMNLLGKYEPGKLSRTHNMNTRTDFDENGRMEDCPSHYSSVDYSADFHVFTLKWTTHAIEWYVDGKLKRKESLFYFVNGQMAECSSLKTGGEYILNRAFPMVPMEIIIDNIVQVGDNSPASDTEFPMVFEIDYVRVYQQN